MTSTRKPCESQRPSSPNRNAAICSLLRTKRTSPTSTGWFQVFPSIAVEVWLQRVRSPALCSGPPVGCVRDAQAACAGVLTRDQDIAIRSKRRLHDAVA
jgi:hypothetical protein